MARLPALVNALARTDGRPRATLDVIGRAIREAGLITTTRRGEGAAHMTARDATNLLIGANAVQAPRLAADAVRQFRTLKQSPHGRHSSGDGLAAAFGLLAACDTLGPAIELLITEAGNLDGLFLDWTQRAFGAAADDRHLGPTLTVTFSRSVEIAVHVPHAEGPRLEHYFRFMADADRLLAGFYTALEGGADRRVTTTIGLPTLCALHDCIFDLIRDPAAEDAGC